MKILASSLSALAVLSIISIGTVALPDEAMAYACKSFPNQSIGVRKRKMMARGIARVNWQKSTKSQYGLPWSVWKIAKNKSITCAYLQDIKKWRCLSSAKPCQYVVQ